MGFRVNVRNCKRAAVSADTSSAYTLGNVVAMPTLRSVDIAFTTSSGALYGDGEKVSEIALITGATLQLAIDKLTSADIVALTGSAKSAKGVISHKTTDTPPKTAIYFEIEHDDGGYEACWLLVGKAQPLGINAQQREDNITYSTESLTMNFIRREKDKAVIMRADTDDNTFDTAAQTSFASGPDI